MLQYSQVPTEVLVAALDALPYSIAVLDQETRIVAVNQTWLKFAKENGGNGEASLGVSYLDVCDGASAEAKPAAKLVASGLASLQRGRPCFQVDYECSSPTLERWFTVLGVPAGDHFLVMHRETTVRKTLASHEAKVNSDLMAIATGDYQPVMEPVNLASILEPLVRNRPEATVRIAKQLWVMGDRKLLTIAVHELLARSGDQLISVSGASTAEHVVVSIRDSQHAAQWNDFGVEPFDWATWDGGTAFPYARAVVQLHAGQMMVNATAGTGVHLVLSCMAGAPEIGGAQLDDLLRP